MAISIKDTQLKALHGQMTKANQTVDEKSILKVLAAVADDTGKSSTRMLTELSRPGLTPKQQLDITSKGMSASEKKDLCAILDEGKLKMTPYAKAFLEAVVGRGELPVPGVKLDTVREGVELLSALMVQADEFGKADGKVSKYELKKLVDQFGDGGSMDAALNNLFKYVQASSGNTSPTTGEIDKALSTAMASIAKADKGLPGLDDKEQAALAKTWKSIVEFAVEYKGSSIDDLVSVGHE